MCSGTRGMRGLVRALWRVRLGKRGLLLGGRDLYGMGVLQGTSLRSSEESVSTSMDTCPLTPCEDQVWQGDEFEHALVIVLHMKDCLCLR